MQSYMERVARLPWVTRLEKTQPCDGYRYAHMPLKARGDPALMAKFKCKNRARWKFRSLKRSWARDGVYCWSHLLSLGLMGDQLEWDRLERGLAKLTD